MQYRQLGKTGLKISEIGYGAWGIGGGWGPKDDDTALESLRKAFELGSISTTLRWPMERVTVRR